MTVVDKSAWILAYELLAGERGERNIKRLTPVLLFVPHSGLFCSVKARLHRRFLSRNSMQFSWRSSSNFKIARVNQGVKLTFFSSSHLAPK